MSMVTAQTRSEHQAHGVPRFAVKATPMALIVVACALSACDQGKPGDPYDASKMDFKSPSALVTSQRHTGSFSAGESLTTDALLKPLTAAPVSGFSMASVLRLSPVEKSPVWRCEVTSAGGDLKSIFDAS